MGTRRNAVAVVVVLLAAGCGLFSGSAEVEATCSIADAFRFSPSYLDGPEMSHDEFIRSDTGRILERFFVGGSGEPENQQYVESDGFSQVSESVVLGYRENAAIADFEVDDGRVVSWGGCLPNLVRGDWVAYRWRPVMPLDRDATLLPIVVDGGGCVTDDGTDVTTEIREIGVVEEQERVEITVWAEDVFLGLACAGVGVSIDADATLSEPLGDRILYDGGLVPPREPAPF